MGVKWALSGRLYHRATEASDNTHKQRDREQNDGVLQMSRVFSVTLIVLSLENCYWNCLKQQKINFINSYISAEICLFEKQQQTTVVAHCIYTRWFSSRRTVRQVVCQLTTIVVCPLPMIHCVECAVNTTGLFTA